MTQDGKKERLDRIEMLLDQLLDQADSLLRGISDELAFELPEISSRSLGAKCD